MKTKMIGALLALLFVSACKKSPTIAMEKLSPKEAKATTKKILNQKNTDLKKCYDSEKEASGVDFEFISTVYFELTKEGKTKGLQIQIESPIPGESLGKIIQCMAAVIQSQTQFPTLKGNENIHIEYPLTFKD